MATNQIQAIGGFSSEDLQVMKQTLAAGTSDAQFGLFIRTAAAANLNPFLSHIYAIVYNGKMSLQISVEGILYLARQRDGYLGIDAQIICDNDEFKASRNKSGEWEIVQHDVIFPRGKTIAAYAVAFREGFKPYTVLMDMAEVEHNLVGTNAALWKKYTNDMFLKTVKKRAAKGQFGIDISEDDNGATPEPNIDNIQPYQREDVTPQPQNDTVEPSKPKADTKARNTQEAVITQSPAGQPTQEQVLAVRNLRNKNFELLGITEKAAKAKYVCDKLGIAPDVIPTFEQSKQLLDIMADEITKAMPDELE